MDRAEAKRFLIVPEDTSLEDAYEQELFVWKNFFVHRFPVTKLFVNKLVQISRLTEAYEVLSETTEAKSEPMAVTAFSNDLKEAFTLYTSERNLLKQRLFACNTGTELKEIVEALIRLTRGYALVWKSDFDLEGEVFVSKEPDAMELLAALEDAKQQEVTQIETILKLPRHHMVQTEAKRLSLWLKMDTDE